MRCGLSPSPRASFLPLHARNIFYPAPQGNKPSFRNSSRHHQNHRRHAAITKITAVSCISESLPIRVPRGENYLGTRDQHSNLAQRPHTPDFVHARYQVHHGMIKVRTTSIFQSTAGVGDTRFVFFKNMEIFSWFSKAHQLKKVVEKNSLKPPCSLPQRRYKTHSTTALAIQYSTALPLQAPPSPPFSSLASSAGFSVRVQHYCCMPMAGAPTLPLP